jgi:hypothetical protein
MFLQVMLKLDIRRFNMFDKMYRKEKIPTMEKWNGGENKGLHLVVPHYKKTRKPAIIKAILLLIS